jgi:ribosomal protein S12 methylthiotransferase
MAKHRSNKQDKFIRFVILGCPKNRADAESVAGILSEAGYFVAEDEKKANTAIVFTCAFLRDAEDESIEAITELEDLKRKGEIEHIIVVGCLPERHKDEKDIESSLPGVDAWIGASDYKKLPRILSLVHDGRRCFRAPDKLGYLAGKEKRLKLGTAPYAYLKISEGCRNRCAYCAIPSIKGALRSRPLGRLIREAESLVKAGVKELVVVGQDTTSYGLDRCGKPKLSELLRGIAAELPDTWIRVMYCHPAHLDVSVLETIAEFKNICPYIDMPVQHISDKMLRAMGRSGSGSKIKKVIENARETIPDLALRTTLMVGFPGETESDFRELLEFAQTVRFDRLGAFAYSGEEGTRAYNMPRQVSERIKQRRLDVIMRAQQEISLDKNQNMVGKTIEVIVDGVSFDRPDFMETRSRFHAPEIDGAIYVPKGKLKPGDLIKVKISDGFVYDLEGKPVKNKRRN